MKKIFILLVGISLIFGITKDASTESYSGFYVGGDVGATHYKIKLKIDNRIETLKKMNHDNFKRSYGLHAGYNWRPEKGSILLGVEGHLSGSEAEATFDEANRVWTIRDDYTSGIALRAGGIINDDLLLYGRLGALYTRFSGTGERETTAGLRFGGGIELKVSNEISLRGEYTRTEYRNIEERSATRDLAMKISQHLFILGIAHHF